MGRQLLACLFLCCMTLVHAQETEHDHHLSDAAKHNIKKATTLALLPGAGQIYNKKYWKVPIVWGALGGAGYYYQSLNSDFNRYKDVLQLMIDQPDLTTRAELELAAPEVFEALPSPFFQTSASGIATETIGYMDALREQREYAVFGIIAIYVLNILDANIDAHLYDFDVSDDLSLRPSILSDPRSNFALPATVGVSLTYTFP